MYNTNEKRGDGPLENKDTVAAADIVGNLCRKAFVVHEEEVEAGNIAFGEAELEEVWSDGNSGECLQEVGEGWRGC